MPELRRTELHILAEADTRSITKEALPALRRFDFSQSYPRDTFDTSVGCIPDISVSVFVALWPHRGHCPCLFFALVVGLYQHHVVPLVVRTTPKGE